MYKRCQFAIILLLTLGVVVFAGGRRETEVAGEPSSSDIFISVIGKGFQHDFWQTVKEGARTAADELGIRTTFEGPATETMVDVQLAMMRNAMIRRSTGILVAALDADAMVPLVEDAAKLGIAVAVFDSGVNSDIPVTVVATDNRVAGALAADRLARLVGGRGVVGVIVHDDTSQTAMDRRGGFLDRIARDYPEVRVLEPVYGGGFHDRSSALVTSMVRSNPDLVGVFATNEGSAVGAALGLQEAGATGRVKLVGFDASAQQVQLLLAEMIDGLVVQNPFNMGYLGVRALYDHIVGRPVPARIDTGAVYVDLSNLYRPEIQTLINPSPR